MAEPSDSYLRAFRAFELKRAREAASNADDAAPLEPEKSAVTGGTKISAGTANPIPRRPFKPLPRPPSKVGGTACASIPSRDSVTGTINYNFPTDFPASSRDQVKAEEISAAQEINEKIKAARSEWKIPALRVSCAIRSTRAYLREAIQLGWGADRIDSQIRAFFLNAQIWAGLATDSGEDALVVLLQEALPAKAGTTDAILNQPETKVVIKGQKRGPKPRHDRALLIAAIVARVVPGGNWLPNEYAIRKALDKAGVTCPTPWSKRDRGCDGWEAQLDRGTAVKAIEYQLKLAKRLKKTTPETLS